MADSRPLILVVDDEPYNLMLLQQTLCHDYQVETVAAGQQALDRLRHDPKPDLVLLDVMMPGMDGFEVCRQIKADPTCADIPVIFVTALISSQEETLGLSLGAADYLTKPLSLPIVQARVRHQIQLKQANDRLNRQKNELEYLVGQRTLELSITRDVTILSMASLAEARDSESGNHVRRTQAYVDVLARHLSSHPDFHYLLDDANVSLIAKSAPLHDIGKIGIPDRILLKPARLSIDEHLLMQSHTTIGRDAILVAEETLTSQSGVSADRSFLRYAREIVYSHHEKWDGTGYPQQLAGDDIPLSARMMALADVYDALISNRPYKRPVGHGRAVEIIAAERGYHFDPRIVDAFLTLESQFDAIAQRYADPELNADDIFY